MRFTNFTMNHLYLISDFSTSENTVDASTVDEAVNQLSLDLRIKLKQTNLITQRDTTLCKEESCPSVRNILSQVEWIFDNFLTFLRSKIYSSSSKHSEWIALLSFHYTTFSFIRLAKHKPIIKRSLCSLRKSKLHFVSVFQFVKTVKENKSLLKDESLGTIRSAGAFLKVLAVARTAPKEDLVKVLKNTKNKKIM